MCPTPTDQNTLEPFASLYRLTYIAAKQCPGLVPAISFRRPLRALVTAVFDRNRASRGLLPSLKREGARAKRGRVRGSLCGLVKDHILRMGINYRF